MSTSVIIFALTCAVMILSVLFKPCVKIAGRILDTYWLITLAGAALMLVAKCVKPSSVIAAFFADTAVNPVKILVLFVSMTALSIFLDEAGFFAYLADKTLKKAKTSQLKLFVYLYITVSVLTVFTSNDIIILTFTPFICYFSKNAGIDPVPYLVAEFIAANTWSMALVIGNPTNIYLASSYGIGFVEYMEVMLVPTVCAGVVAFAVLWALFYKKLSTPLCPTVSDVKITNKPLLVNGIIHLSLCTVILAVGSYVGFEMWAVSFIAAVSLALSTLVICLVRREKPDKLTATAKRLPWQLAPFMLSMFVMVLALTENHITEAVTGLLHDGNTVFEYGIASFLTDNVINNIPMSVLFCSVIKPLDGMEQVRAVFAAIVGSNLGAFLTPIGALAGIMWSQLLSKQHIRFSYGDFIKYGAAISLPALMSALGALSVVLA